MKSVDRILKGFQRTVNQLKKTEALSRQAAAEYQEIAADANGRAAVYGKEAERAHAVANKIESLLEA